MNELKKVKLIKIWLMVSIDILFFIIAIQSSPILFKFALLTNFANKLFEIIFLLCIINIGVNFSFYKIEKLFKQKFYETEKMLELQIENEKLRKDSVEQEKIFNQRLTEYKMVHKIIKLMLQSIELKKVLNISLELICRFLTYDRAIVYLYDREKNVLNCVSGYNVDQQDLTSASINVGEQSNFITQTVTKKRPCIAGVVQDFNVAFKIFDSAAHPDIIASVPLESRNKIVGVLVVDNVKSKRRIFEKDLRNLINFTDMLGLAIENAKLYETEKNFSEELNRKLNEAIEKLKLAQQKVIQVETLAALGRMSAIISHELRNMLTSIKNSAEVIFDKVPQDSQERKYSSYILREVERLNKVVDDILTVGQNVQIMPMPNDLNKVIIETMQTIELMDINNKYGISLVLNLDQNLPTGYFDKDRIKQVVLNIVQNAIYFLLKSEKKEIRISTLYENNNLILEITDSGLGIEPKILEKIFDPFYTTKPNGTGLGLTICKNIISAHNGKIEVESEVGKGTKFTIILPL